MSNELRKRINTGAQKYAFFEEDNKLASNPVNISPLTIPIIVGIFKAISKRIPKYFNIPQKK